MSRSSVASPSTSSTRATSVQSDRDLKPDIKSKATEKGLSDEAVFAPVYQPQWLYRVNSERPQLTLHRTPFESGPVNYVPHARFFVPPELFALMIREEETSIQNLKRDCSLVLGNLEPPLQTTSEDTWSKRASSRIVPVAPPGMIKSPKATIEPPVPRKVAPGVALPEDVIKRMSPLTAETYGLFWLPLQALEVKARKEHLVTANLYRQPLKPLFQEGDPPGVKRYKLVAHSIREGWPPVDLGDKLFLRQLYETVQDWQRIVFEATVTGINRALGEVIIRCDTLASYEQYLIFNITWEVQTSVFDSWQLGVSRIEQALKGLGEKTSARALLFPDSSHIESAASNAQERLVLPWTMDLPWVDAALNEEQRNAVRSITNARQRIPLLISGPPGTGKTKTLVESILQILKKHPHTHILVCGASPPSADTLALRLAEHLEPKDMFRLNHPRRPFGEVRDRLMPYCHSEAGRFELPTPLALAERRVIVSTCLDTSLLLQARCTNADMSRVETYIRQVFHSHSPAPVVEPHFGFLLVDEAAQATELETACALSVVVVDTSLCRPAHVTLCGDARQLGPQITSRHCRDADMDLSLLERLSARSVYSDHPYARKNRKKNPDVKWSLETPFVDLVRSYRSCTPILMCPSTLFYHETLVPAARPSIHNSPLHKWPKLPAPNFPIHFHGLRSPDFPIEEGASFFNNGEIDFVTKTITELVKAMHGKPALLRSSEISVISPFREQVWRIRQALRKLNLHDVDVGNVESLQGAENRVVIISTVRTRPQRLKLDVEHNRGLVHDSKRWNVAMTRAKELLIVVGNPDILLQDPNWRAFYRFCRRFKCYTGVEIEDPSLTGGAEDISRLEQNWSEGGEVDAEAQWDRLVSSLAKQAIVDDEEEE